MINTVLPVKGFDGTILEGNRMDAVPTVTLTFDHTYDFDLEFSRSNIEIVVVEGENFVRAITIKS